MAHILSFSGGKDSTFLLLELLRRGKPLDECVFFDTGWEFPQMYTHIERIKELCASHNVKFTTLHPERSFDYMMFEKPIRKRAGGVRHGFSWCGARGIRWGTAEKQRTLTSYTKPTDTVYIGIAADETKRLEKKRPANQEFPLATWGITEPECLQGCYKAGYDWGGLYKYLDRVSCWCCEFKNLKELRNIYFHMPDVWQQLRDMQAKTYMPFKQNASIFDLEKRFEFEREREKAGLSITNRDFFAALTERLGQG